MLKTALSQSSERIYRLVTWLRGFEESGHIGIDAVSLKTRFHLRDLGVI